MKTPPLSDDDAALDALFAAARAQRPDTSRAEYGFETRLLARITGRKSPARDGWIEFAAWCWRLVPGVRGGHAGGLLVDDAVGRDGIPPDESFFAVAAQVSPASDDDDLTVGSMSIG